MSPSNLRMEAFEQWSIGDWIKELINLKNVLPLNIYEKLRLLNFDGVLMEQVWMIRKKTRLNLCPPTWEELSEQIPQIASS